MPSITFYTPWNSKRTGPSVTNPMFAAANPPAAKAQPTPERTPSPAPPQLTLPEIDTSDSILSSADWDVPSQRQGKLKTVGGSEEDREKPAIGYDIPDFDFGPTLNFAADTLPEDKVKAINAGVVENRNRSQSTSMNSSRSVVNLDARPSTSLNEQWRRISKYNQSSGGLSTASGASRPGTAMSHFRKMSNESRVSGVFPNGHHRRTSSGMHSMYSMTNGSNLALQASRAPSRMLTPESMDTARPGSRGTIGRPGSRGTMGRPCSRGTIADQHARPYSRGTLAASPARMYNQYSPHASPAPAPVLRGPLINHAHSPSRNSMVHSDAGFGGLIGTIDARQREKEVMKAAGGYNPHVAAAIRERETAAAIQQMTAAQMQSLAFQGQQFQMQLMEQQQMAMYAQQQQFAQQQQMAAGRGYY